MVNVVVEAPVAVVNVVNPVSVLVAYVTTELETNNAPVLLARFAVFARLLALKVVNPTRVAPPYVMAVPKISGSAPVIFNFEARADESAVPSIVPLIDANVVMVVDE